MKTFSEFQEGVASLAVKGGSKLIPALVTGIGAAGTYLQSKGKFGKDAPQTRKGLKNIVKNVDKNKLEPDTASEREELVAKSDPNLKKLDKIDKAQDNAIKFLKKRGVNLSAKPPFADTPSAEELRKAKLTGKLIKPKQGESKKTEKLIDKYKKEDEVSKQRELIRNTEKQITKPKKGEKKEALKTLKDFLKARKIEGRTMMRIKQDADISKKGPGDQVPGARRDYLKNLLKNLRIKNLRKEEVALANSMSGGGIAGSVEAGHEPPVNKRKKKGEPTIMARGLLPGARTRFKTGADFLTNIKKNKYT